MSGATLIVTNDFGPRVGGIEAFVQSMASRLAQAGGAGSVVVHTARQPESAAFDADLPYAVVRDDLKVLLPTAGVVRRCARTAREFGCDRVWFGSAAPLAQMAPALREAGIRRAVATTHSAEEWWSRLPGTRSVLHRIGDRVDTVTYLGEHSRRALSGVLSESAREQMRHLPPGVDVERYHPGVDGARLRAQLGLADRPVVVSISRLIRRKGQDALIEAWPRIQDEVPGAALVIVGDGPSRPRLQTQVEQAGLGAHIMLTGQVPWSRTPEYFALGDVFAMPTRTRLLGLEPEGVPLSALEAQASGLPVVIGDSGGAPDTIRDGVTGHVVNGRDLDQVARAVVDLLSDRQRALAWGMAGRDFVTQRFQWDDLAADLQQMLDPDEPDPDSAQEED
ncbi:glycosyltransferase family 4 protein [Ornithinimicrobium faecis]|uniref:D-inositol 3-phosphate glycosyltransferase n=1 Tax=Ornithinimicrobium faecis TaxID=2934158 RepID=A0ABY4YRL4_9MICO|nr:MULTISPECIES: glycosyltransferase family 4 protein [unclassified Ornithinimicrobium]USQ78807.1 glycosyltransferase family 4 protein [Ornithinimicrobium sp. HY1793]